jgi:hypothetical protein
LYCFTYINNLTCVLNELMLWSDISSEHPIFIKTVGGLTSKNLPAELVENLLEVNRMFTDLKQKTMEVIRKIRSNPYMYLNHIGEVRNLVKEFLSHDMHFLELLPEIRQIEKEDMVWQTLLEHITEEQKFMYEIMTDLKIQLGA